MIHLTLTAAQTAQIQGTSTALPIKQDGTGHNAAGDKAAKDIHAVPPHGESVNEQSAKDGARGKKEAGGVHKQVVVWSPEEDRRLFQLFKERGATWSDIAKEFNGRTESQVKNRFYSTLRRVATKRGLETHAPPRSSIHLSKLELLQYVDEAIESGHTCFSKRGRKKKRPLPKSDSPPSIPEVPKKVLPPPVPTPPSTFPRVPYTCPPRPRIHLTQAAPQVYNSVNPVRTVCRQQMYRPPPVVRGPVGPIMYQPQRYYRPAWVQPPPPRPEVSVGVQARLEELVMLQQSIINMLLQSGSPQATERSTGFKK